VAQKISIDTPLGEITLRKYERPAANMAKRDLVRKLCLSLGLLQPGDSRDVIVDVLQVILEAEEELTSTEVERRVIHKRKEQRLQLLGVAPSNIRRQLLRLRDLFLVEKVKNNYRVRENALLRTIFDESIQQYYLDSIINRVKEYVDAVDSTFLKKR
jgi:DNA-binding transcriptional ArsR family regulator